MLQIISQSLPLRGRLEGVVLFLLLFPIALSAQVGFGNAVKFNDHWLFSLSDDADYRLEQCDDSRWRRLSLPHDWSREGRLSPTLASCQGYLPAGVGWYRKRFTVDFAAKHYYIYFEGVYNRSEVYLNGELLGKRPNGYVSFLYDMTPHLKQGENVLSVRVDHSRLADSRWYTGSGIYRDVWLVSADDVHFSQWGVGARLEPLGAKSRVQSAKCRVLVDAEVEAHTAISGKTEVVATLTDADGRQVAKASTKIKFSDKNASGKSRFSTASLTLTVGGKDAPHLWSTEQPYLYRLTTSVFVDGVKRDESSTPIGLRYLHFDADNGFALNGKAMKVKGVCLHHDAGTLGAAVPEEVWERRLTNLKALGVNAIRMSHNPQAPAVYDLCDRLGLLVMDEASDEWEFPKRKWVEGWNVGKPAFDGSYDFFEEWIDRDVTDMVRRDRNHPCVFLWSIGNEVDYPNDPYSHPILDGTTINQPMFGGYKPDAPQAERIGKIAKRLAACVRKVDTSRPVTGALAGVVMSNETEYPEAVDVVGYNYTENRYDLDHEKYPQRIIYGSETHSSIEAWNAVKDRKHIFGQFIWTGTDYLGESGRWPSRGLGTGLLDFMSEPKPRGHHRAALWCEKPTIYIGTRPAFNRQRRHNQENNKKRIDFDAPDVWNYEEGSRVRVSCYTNTPKARLLLNGKVIGEMTDTDEQTAVTTWDVDYAPGALVAEGCDKEGNVLATYTIETSGLPCAISATADKAELSADRATAHVFVRILDENGRLVRLADNEITCHISGPARLLGMDNGSNSDMSDYNDNRHRANGGKLLLYLQTTGKEGDITVRLSSPLLKATTIKLKAVTHK